MHEFLKSIGFSGIHTSKQLDALLNWVLEKPDSLNIISTGHETNLAQAQRGVSGHAGISVVGEMDENGTLIPEYYYPFISSTHISSEARISCEKQSERNGYVGMLEDFRMGMALIFSVHNVAEVAKRLIDDPFHTRYRKCLLSALASDGMILLGQEIPERVLQKRQDELKERRRLMREANEGNEKAIEALAGKDIHEYHTVLHRLNDHDIYTLVKSFFMPYGIETERYYFLGTILACRLAINEYTGEKFYNMLVDTNDMELSLAINEADLLGIPEPGLRIRCHAWLMGEIK